MKNIILEIKYKIDHWLFMNGFLREVITHYGSNGIESEYAFGFSLTRKWREKPLPYSRLK